MQIPFIARTRRNHALEHATIQILNRHFPTRRLTGWSTPSAFFVHGDLPTAAVQDAAREALTRLQGGERHLAIHPHCGTNIVTAGTLVGFISFLTMLPGSKHSRRERLPLVLLLSTLVLMLAQPLGPLVQEHVTTQTDLAGTQVARVDRLRAGQLPVHRIRLDYLATV